MSKRFGYLLLCSGLLAGLLFLPMVFPELTAAELTAGRFLVTFFVCLMILPFRSDCLNYLNCHNTLQWFQRSLFGGVLFCLFLLIVVRELGLLAACLLIVLLPALARAVILNSWDKTNLSILALLTTGLVILVGSLEQRVDAFGNTIVGSLSLALAIICWLVSARVQLRMLREMPQIDSSNQLLLTGLMSLPALLVLLLLSNGHWYELELMPATSSLLLTHWYGFVFAGLLLGIVGRMLWYRLNDNEGGSASDTVAPTVILTITVFYAVQGIQPELSEWLVLLMLAGSLILESGCRREKHSLKLSQEERPAESSE